MTDALLISLFRYYKPDQKYKYHGHDCLNFQFRFTASIF